MLKYKQGFRCIIGCSLMAMMNGGPGRLYRLGKRCSQGVKMSLEGRQGSTRGCASMKRKKKPTPRPKRSRKPAAKRAREATPAKERKKSTQAEMHRRVHEVLALRLGGAEFPDIV